jgi:hypothetical protein
MRRRRLIKEAQETIDLVKAIGVDRHQSVIVLVFDSIEGDVTGYMNVDPILAALALVGYLEQTHPKAKQKRTSVSRSENESSSRPVAGGRSARSKK